MRALLQVLLGCVAAVVVALAASVRDPIGWGYLLSTHVDQVAEARLSEPLVGMPPMYVLSAVLAGAGVVLGLPDESVWLKWAAGVLVATFVLVTIWDLRRRRGTLAVYIRLRRAEMGFTPKGSVIEVPKLMFLVMNQPTPLVWLVTAAAIVAFAIGLFPSHSWYAVGPLGVLAAAAVATWLRHRTSQWERLARRLRRASALGGPRLTEWLEHSLDLDPEVLLVRREADSMVARIMGDDR